jgi:hypothetical protein
VPTYHLDGLLVSPVHGRHHCPEDKRHSRKNIRTFG